MTRLTRWLRTEPLIVLMWVLEAVRLAWPLPGLDKLGAALVVALAVVALPRMPRQTLALSTMLGAVAVGLATWIGAWEEALAGLARAPVFSAFLLAILLLRATADRRRETVLARQVFGALDARERAGGMLVGAHVIGAPLVVGVMAILSSVFGRYKSAAERRAAAELCQRGMCLAPLWSPFWVAMAISYQHLPTVPLWQVIALGLPLSVVGLALSHVMFARRAGFGGLLRATRGLAPILPAVALCAAVVIALASFTTLTTLQALIFGVPALCALTLAASGVGELFAAARSAWGNTSGIAADLVLLSAALVLGRVLEAALVAGDVGSAVAAMALSPAVLIAGVIFLMTVTSLAGVHQIVSITVVLAVLAPLPSGLADVVLLEAGLVGWAFASMVGITAVSVAVASAMFDVPRERLAFGPNLLYVAVFGAVAVTLLTAVNAAIV